ncbi:MAG: hypothetical protein L0H59_04340 [Tomitella sp.]|nr:hypothetical protein [Tomitella sp.]
MPNTLERPEITDLTKDRAQELLGRLHTLRHIRAAYDDEVTQSQIARERGISQAHVHRLLKITENNHEIIAERPREVIWKRAVGLVTSEHMIDELANWEYATTQREPATPLPESVPGAWTDVENALIEGLITETEVDTIADRSGMQ